MADQPYSQVMSKSSAGQPTTLMGPPSVPATVGALAGGPSSTLACPVPTTVRAPVGNQSTTTDANASATSLTMSASMPGLYPISHASAPPNMVGNVVNETEVLVAIVDPLFNRVRLDPFAMFTEVDPELEEGGEAPQIWVAPQATRIKAPPHSQQPNTGPQY